MPIMQKFKSIHDFLALLQQVKETSKGHYQAVCPAHEDKSPSLSVTESTGKILLKCFAGCDNEAIVAKLRLTMADLFLDGKNPPATATKPAPVVPKLIATYKYTDEHSNLLYERCRYLPKTFRERRPDGKGGYLWDMKNVKRVIYHLPDIIQCFDNSIYWVEGEKDADNLWNYGSVATTSGGVNSWLPQFADYFVDRKVVIIPDKDTPGFSHARQVAKAIRNKAKEVRAIILPGDTVKDVSDWIDQGGYPPDLANMEQDASVLFRADSIPYEKIDDGVIWEKNLDKNTLTFKAENIRDEPTGIHAKVSIIFNEGYPSYNTFNISRSDERIRLAGQAIKKIKAEGYTKDGLETDLDRFCDGLWMFEISSSLAEEVSGTETVTPLVYMLRPYIIEEGGSVIFAPPGRGKSYTGLLWAQSINHGINKFWQVTQSKVLFINLERSKSSIQRRLAMVNKILGLSPTAQLLMINQRGKTLASVTPMIRQAIKQYGVKVIILDSISRAGYGDLTDNKAMNSIVDALNGICPTWVALAHTPRQSEDHAFGSIMLDAGADVQIQLASQVKDNGVLGVGLEITKTNDIPPSHQTIWAYEFDDVGLSNVRVAKEGEFVEIMGKAHQNMEEAIIDFISNTDSGKATAWQIEKDLGFDRSNISSLLNSSPKFMKLDRNKDGQYFGVRTSIM